MLEPLRRRRAGRLSGGEQQATAIGRALMTNPRVLLLDEVSLGLAPVAVEGVYASLRSLIERGTTTLLVEQDLSRALSVANRVVCMLEGRIVLEGPAAELTRGADRRCVLRAGTIPEERRPGVTWLNQVVQGVLLGGYFAILASGLALLFGVMRIINLAHGDLAVLGAFLVLVLTDHGVDAFVSLAVVLPVMAVGGVLLYRLILERSLRTGCSRRS